MPRAPAMVQAIGGARPHDEVFFFHVFVLRKYLIMVSMYVITFVEEYFHVSSYLKSENF